MKRLSSIFILFFIILLFTSGGKDVVLKYNAKQIYNIGFSELKPLDSTEIQYLANQFDIVSNWDNFRYMVFSYPLDTIGKNYNLKRKQYLHEFLNTTNSFSFPIKLNSRVLNCFLITTTDTTNYQYYRFLKIFFYNKDTPRSEPVLLLSFCEFSDGLSIYTEYSDCTMYSDSGIVSKFIQTRESLDLQSFDNQPRIPDTVIMEMKITDKSSLEIINNYDSRNNINE